MGIAENLANIYPFSVAKINRPTLYKYLLVWDLKKTTFSPFIARGGDVI
jgi:hypothetical protein